MKLKNNFKLNTNIPASAQSDIAFLLIIFFIVTAIFFERTGIIFKLPEKSGKTLKLTAREFIEIKAYNDFLIINKEKIDYSKIYSVLEAMKRATKRNIAIVYFSDDLKYEKFINIFQAVKKAGDIKISIKPLDKK